MKTEISTASLKTPPVSNAAPTRIASVDAYRGFVMFLMMAEVLEFGKVAAALPGNSFWAFLARNQNHVQWGGCVLHDLIQPSFSFLVGVALPFSLARRKAEGQSQFWLTLHAFWRALVLVLLGVFLRSVGQDQTNWTFVDTLTQIGLGYGFLYMLAWRSPRVQWSAFAAIVFFYWLAFALYPLPDPHFKFDYHWHYNTNLGWAFDTWFLNLFPREAVFTHNPGGYSTLNFIPTLATMILGLFAGEVLRGPRAPMRKIQWFAVVGAIGLALGVFFDKTGICPVVKRIWTPSWVLFSGGWCFILLAAFYFVIDIRNRCSWAFPLIVVGMNSIAAYLIAHLFTGFITEAFPRHLGSSVFNIFGPAYQPAVLGACVLLMEWLMLLWMHRRKIFLRI